MLFKVLFYFFIIFMFLFYYFVYVSTSFFMLLNVYYFSFVSLFICLFKGVMAWEVKFALIFWHIRGLCTIKTSYKFYILKCPPHYKQIIYLIKLQKWLVLDLRGKVMSPGHSRLHKHRF